MDFGKPIECYTLALADIGDNILGVDLVLGVPDLERMNATIYFTSNGSKINWNDIQQRVASEYTANAKSDSDQSPVAYLATTCTNPIQVQSQTSKQYYSAPPTHASQQIHSRSPMHQVQDSSTKQLVQESTTNQQDFAPNLQVADSAPENKTKRTQFDPTSSELQNILCRYQKVFAKTLNGSTMYTESARKIYLKTLR